MANIEESEEEESGFSQFAIKLFSVALLALTAFLFWQAGEIFLLVFAGILLAVFLQTFGRIISKRLRISYPIALIVLILSLILISIVLWKLSAPILAKQAALLIQELPKAFSYLQAQIDHYIPFSEEAVKTTFANFDILQHITNIFSSTMGAITGIIVFLFVGIYLAFDSSLYIRGFLKLFPPGKRVITDRVLSSCGETLRSWLFGQLIAMATLGTATFIGLYLLEVPLALILGLLAAVLTFLPTLGPILASIPAILMALVQGPLQVAYVIALYIVIQVAESYFITPYIQKKTTALPPALVVVVQILMGVLAGILGLALAAPLTAVAIVLIDQVYVKEILGNNES